MHGCDVCARVRVSCESEKVYERGREAGRQGQCSVYLEWRVALPCKVRTCWSNDLYLLRSSEWLGGTSATKSASSLLSLAKGSAVSAALLGLGGSIMYRSYDEA
jgi:hypothetical protein